MKHLFTFTLLLVSSLAMAERMDPQTKLWNRAGFKNPEFSSIQVPIAATQELASGIPATHALDATIVMFRNSGWSKEQMEAHLKRTNEIYTQCGIRMGRIDFVEADAYQGKLDILNRWTTEGDDYAISKATPIESRPVIYLLRNILPQNPATQEGAFTNLMHFWAPLEPVTQNTIWISNIINKPEYGMYYDMEADGKSLYLARDPSYNVVAHEIAHLLADMGHETELKEKNLLNGSNAILGEHLLPRQCERFKRSPLLRKL